MVSAGSKRFAPFRLDSVNECLWRSHDDADEERIPLTPKAFAVLQCLIEHAGRLVTQAELLEAVWPEVVVQPEVLKTQIRTLRLALGDDPSTPKFIQTLHRRGYAFIAPVSDVTLPERSDSAPHRLVGRAATLQILQQHLRIALGGHRQLVFITGEPGIGKSAVIEAFERQAAAALTSLRVARGQCIEGFGGKEPFYPMLDALGQLLRGPHREESIQILALQAPTWLVQFPALLTRQHRELLQSELLGNTRERMLREICAALETMSSLHPLLIVLEDLQWVDEATVGLISALARRRHPAQLTIVGSFRAPELTQDNHALQTLARELLVHNLCHEIALPALTLADVAAYVQGPSRDTDPTDGLAGLIHRHTEGNPLFMVAALEHMTRQGLLAQHNGSWHLAVSLQEIHLAVPETLREMIEARIERLSIEEQRVLETASAVGTVFSAEICAAVSKADPEHLECLLENLTRRQQLVRRAPVHLSCAASDAQPYEFRHALYREVFYHRMAGSQRARLDSSICQWLRASVSRAPQTSTQERAHQVEQGSRVGRRNKRLGIDRDSNSRRFATLESAFA